MKKKVVRIRDNSGDQENLTGLFCVRCGCEINSSPKDWLKGGICGKCPVTGLSAEERKALYCTKDDKLPLEIVLKIAQQYMKGAKVLGFISQNATYSKELKYGMSEKEVKRML